MRCLVTGASGFIGKHLVRALLRTDGISSVVGTAHKYRPGTSDLYCDITAEDQVAALLRNVRPNIIFHIAGKATIKEDEQDRAAITRTNVLGTHHLLAHAPQGCRFVLASSAAVYGDDAKWGFKCNEIQMLYPSSPYGAAKVAAEALVLAYHNQGKISGLMLRYVANVGRGATHGVVPDLLRKLQSEEEELVLFGDAPGSIKPYCHVSDTVAATILLGMNPSAVGPFNIAPDDNLSILHLAGAMMVATGIRKDIRWGGTSANWKGDNPLVVAPNHWARVYGWRPYFANSHHAVTAATKESL